MDEWEAELLELIARPSEDECLEFKEAKDRFDIDDLGAYFSALSNEANLNNIPYAWLVFGVRDNDHAVVGTNYRHNGTKLQQTKEHIKQGTNDISFIEIRNMNVSGKRVVMFKIPAAPQGIPTSYRKHYYERVNESLQGLSIEKLERIRSQNQASDWSDKPTKATIDSIDTAALALAREKYKDKNPKLSEECNTWTDTQFLQKSKLMKGARLTNAALILLGKPEAEELLTNGAIAQISWILQAPDGTMRDYEHFTMPFILAVDNVYKRIRNLRYRYISGDTLFPDEVNQYETFAMREALHNCIAHQDYLKRGKINVVEVEDDSLVFSNVGTFLPGSVEDVVISDAPQEIYRNRRLAEAMVSLNMIDTVGSGIKKIFESQRKKLFPLPDYDLTDEKVRVKIMGRVLDMEYARKLARMPDIDLGTMILLDKVNKRHPVTREEVLVLRKRKMIEGRYPNVRVALAVSEITDDLAAYLKRRAVDDNYSKKMILQYITVNGTASRSELDVVINDKLSTALTDDQKNKKLSNLLQSLKRDGLITPTQDRKWVLGDTSL